MKISIQTFLIGLVLGAVITFFIKKQIIKEVKVPFKVEVEVPVVKKEFDTIYLPVPEYTLITLVDTTLVGEYKRANDSLKAKLFESAVTIRDYKQVFDDDIQTITVDMNVTGTLNSVFAKYITKPRIVVLDTVLKVDVPDYSRSISVYGEIGMPTQKASIEPPILKAGFDFSGKRNTVWGASFDTEKRVWVKLGKKWNF